MRNRVKKEQFKMPIFRLRSVGVQVIFLMLNVVISDNKISKRDTVGRCTGFQTVVPS